MVSRAHPLVASLACALILIGLPLGAAGQTATMVLAGICALTCASGQTEELKSLLRDNVWKKRSLGAFAAYLGMVAISTWINPHNPSQNVIQHLIGHLPFLFLPMLLTLAWQQQTKSLRYWQSFVAIIVGIWTLAAVSQAIWAWKLDGISLAFDPLFARSQGFYSHPLTFAYALLMLWPFFFNYLLKNLKSAFAWFYVVSLSLMIILSASRMVQICAAFVTIWSLGSQLRGAARTRVLLASLGLGALVMLTPNTASNRFRELFSSHNPDRFSDYQDDRLAFWHAFAGMVQERPVLGHGIDLDRDYRHPYYEAIGLGSFLKQYEAHNQLLQILAESGGIGLGLFLLWLFFVYRSLETSDTSIRLSYKQTFAVFLLGGMTQNVFQDSEVRYTLLFLLSLAYSQSIRQTTDSKVIPFKTIEQMS